jgi:hypothetical protein
MRIRSRPSHGTVVAYLALFVALGGTAMANVIITSNSQVAKDTISGHKAPTGKHPNIIGGSVNGTDLANQAVTPAKLKAPEPWHAVGPGSQTEDLCASTTAVFCSESIGFGSYARWHNYAGGFATAAFYKDQLGIVRLKGLVQGDSHIGLNPATRPIFRLPSAYRPSSRRAFASVGREDVDGQEVAQARVDVLPDGVVELLSDCQNDGSDCSGSGPYVTLDGISFRPDE